MADSTKYVTIKTVVSVSRNSDYSDPYLTDTLTETFTCTRYRKGEVNAATGGTTVDLGEFDSVTKVVITNRDDTNFVEVVSRNTSGGASDMTIRVGPGTTETLGTAITPASDLVLTADSAACECIVEVYGGA